MVSLLGFNSVALLGIADWFSPLRSNKPIIIIPPFISLLFCVRGVSCHSLLFILPSISCVIFIISVCHNFPIVALPIMGMWSKSGKRGVVCAQTGPGGSQLDRSQLPYPENLGLIQQEASQPSITKRPTTTIIWVWHEWINNKKINVSTWTIMIKEGRVSLLNLAP